MPSGVAKTCTDENCNNIIVRVFVHIPLHSRVTHFEATKPITF